MSAVAGSRLAHPEFSNSPVSVSPLAACDMNSPIDRYTTPGVLPSSSTHSSNGKTMKMIPPLVVCVLPRCDETPELG